MKLDWKFVLTLLITVAGVAFPIWLWQADQSSKSISVKLATRIALQPKEQESISGIEISVDGLRLEKPHLVVFEIRNDGTKPIPAADFESPIRIQLESETSFVRANVTERVPKDIEATLLNAPKDVSLKPTLLNPGDIISITAITSGAPPIFNTKARVIGILNVVLEDGTEKKTNKLTIALLFLMATLSFASFSLVIDAIFDPIGFHLRRRAAVAVGLSVMFPGAIAIQLFLDKIGSQGLWYLLLYAMTATVFGTFIASGLNRNQNSPGRVTSEK